MSHPTITTLRAALAATTKGLPANATALTAEALRALGSAGPVDYALATTPGTAAEHLQRALDAAEAGREAEAITEARIAMAQIIAGKLVAVPTAASTSSTSDASPAAKSEDDIGAAVAAFCERAEAAVDGDGAGGSIDPADTAEHLRAALAHLPR